MATDKQIAANRANAAKSTGPKSARGKAISARNSARHGALTTTFILQSECPTRFQAFIESFFQEFIRGKNFQFMKNGYKSDTENNHGKRKAEIQLQKAHPIRI